MTKAAHPYPVYKKTEEGHINPKAQVKKIPNRPLSQNYKTKRSGNGQRQGAGLPVPTSVRIYP